LEICPAFAAPAQGKIAVIESLQQLHFSVSFSVSTTVYSLFKFSNIFYILFYTSGNEK
jgi:hypothetical protein